MTSTEFRFKFFNISLKTVLKRQHLIKVRAANNVCETGGERPNGEEGAADTAQTVEHSRPP